MVSISELSNNVRMVVHGGHDYMDERPTCFYHGHPILTIEIGDKIRHFKCTSVERNSKTGYLQKGLYVFKDPEACQLNHTFKFLHNDTIQPVVDLNHSVYLYKDETPPLTLYKDEHHFFEQTQFEVSDHDKQGILRTLALYDMYMHSPTRLPRVTQEQCQQADQRYNFPHHDIQVVNHQPIQLDMSDLHYSSDMLNHASNLLMN